MALKNGRGIAIPGLHIQKEIGGIAWLKLSAASVYDRR